MPAALPNQRVAVLPVLYSALGGAPPRAGRRQASLRADGLAFTKITR